MAESKTAEERNQLLDAHSNLISLELQKLLLVKSNALRQKGNYSQALAIAELAVTIAEQIQNQAAKAQALNDVGVVHYYQNDYQAALEDHKKSLAIRQSLNENIGIAQSLNNIGRVYFEQDENDLALENFQKALQLSETNRNQQGIADSLHNLGRFHVYQGKYDLALDENQKSLKIREDAGDKAGMAECLRYIARVYFHEADYQTALEYYSRSLSISQSIDDRFQIAAVLSLIGSVHQSRSDYARALEYHQKALEAAQALNDQIYTAYNLECLGSIHEWQGNFDLALEYYQKALELSERMQNKSRIVFAMRHLGDVYESMGKFDESLAALQKGLKLAREWRIADVSDLLISLGNMYDDQGKYADALKYYKESYPLKVARPDKAGIVVTLNNIAEIDLKLGNTTEAIESATRGRDLAKEIERYHSVAIAQTLIGKAYTKTHQYEAAEQALKEAISTSEGIRNRVAAGIREQALFFEHQIEAYHSMIELLIIRDRKIEALNFAEKAKARLLLDVLQNGKINITKAMTVKEKQEEQALNTTLIALNAQISWEKQNSKDLKHLEQLNTDLQKAQLEMEAFQSKVLAAHPELRVQRGETPPIELQETASLLPNRKSALLEYVVTEDRTYLFVITKEEENTAPQLNVFQIETTRKDLAKRVENFRIELASRDIDFSKSAKELFNFLLAPASNLLAGKTTLLIIPDAELWNLPFQSLKTSGDTYLLENYAIAYTPSMTVQREMVRSHMDHQSVNSPTLLAFGNPALANATIQAIQNVYRNEKLLPLPEAETEVQKIAQLYPSSSVKVGREAGEDRFKADAAKFTVLHLATHGILDDNNPMYSKLILSQTGLDKKEDGILEAWEILNMDLHADLAVLSACETARGTIGAGEGIIG
ncbi:MAG TPA: tetratricopeptide repeat protein, partial [Acidobacteriota bacterium]|nr:tetratricopeptide repeat protein [Acidobacteriota bacterium]